MTRWEYAELQSARKIHYLHTASRDIESFKGSRLEALDFFGKDGWEVIDISPDKDGLMIYTLKRCV